MNAGESRSLPFRSSPDETEDSRQDPRNPLKGVEWQSGKLKITVSKQDQICLTPASV